MKVKNSRYEQVKEESTLKQKFRGVLMQHLNFLILKVFLILSRSASTDREQQTRKVTLAPDKKDCEKI